MPRDWARLRQVMYQPSAVWLSTNKDGQRWLTDQFVLYDVTGFEELRDYDFHLDDCTWEETVECSCPDELPDGAYKLSVSKGFQPRDSVPEPDIAAYFEKMSERVWWPAEASEWSVAEHPGKAMLWYTVEGWCLFGEGTWTALKRNHPDVEVEWAANQGAGTFRFREPLHLDPEDDCFAGQCGCALGLPFAFAAGIRCPEGQEGVADAMLKAIRNVPVEAELVEDIHDIEVIEEAA